MDEGVVEDACFALLRRGKEAQRHSADVAVCKESRFEGERSGGMRHEVWTCDSVIDLCWTSGGTRVCVKIVLKNPEIGVFCGFPNENQHENGTLESNTYPWSFLDVG